MARKKKITLSGKIKKIQAIQAKANKAKIKTAAVGKLKMPVPKGIVKKGKKGKNPFATLMGM